MIRRAIVVPLVAAALALASLALAGRLGDRAAEPKTRPLLPKVREGALRVKLLFDAARRIAEEREPRDGVAFGFPASVDWTPAEPCCKQLGGRCAPGAKAWDHPTWRALGFAMKEPHLFQYRFVSDGKGRKARFLIEARADADCNGVYAVYRRQGTFDREGNIDPGPGLQTENDLE
jgi:hypothetical protein